ncbi:TIGR01459 family HAD-type hydrolase [Maritalea porphyrae]|uniref:Haloacid dehalogenase n=1 Tax=Maritalea porphyrae TaxID=880732 RepID=A0ABQ5UUT5_9HYPH|nr:TIGR01459 family HAD-type hydrolase [Maritalea porphyrae]GLQ17737.1 haloacid dehalogenase [Maritalea porphyrae]
MQEMTTPITRRGLSAVKDQFNLIFCDVWGVLHNGERVYQRAVDALQNFRENGGAVIMVTNAPRPSNEIIADLYAMGVPKDTFDALVSSGEVTRDLIADYHGKTIYRLGPDSDDGLFEGIQVHFGSLDEAEAIICSDLEYGRTPDDYQHEVLDWKARGLPFICANPDKFVEIGDELIYCGGALADVYQEAGGNVIMAGKPFRPIYQKASQLALETRNIQLADQKVIAIGDSARTDATGAARIGAGFLFISGSIHAHELGDLHEPNAKEIEKLLAPIGANVVGYSPFLVW